MISAITQEVESVVTCLEDQRHGLEDGDMVKFREIKGMSELNGPDQVRKVKVLSPFTFSIGDTSNLSAYETGCIWASKAATQIYVQVLEGIPQSTRICHFRLCQNGPDASAVGSFHHACKDRESSVITRPRNIEDATAFVDRVKAQASVELEVDEALMLEFGKQLRGYFGTNVCSDWWNGRTEVLKASSGKFGPIYQHFLFDSLESLPVDLSPVEADFAPQDSRYDAQVAVFGCSFQRRIEESQGFLVGSGAIGCEMVKLYALMGVAAGNDRGLLTLTDMDNIEKSNLNRQFLFRPADVGKPKSLTAAEAAFRINPNVKIEARVDRVGETEHIFNTKFFEGLDFVTNALDNVDARRYMDQRCVFYRRPLLESGTLGTKGETRKSSFRTWLKVTVPARIPGKTIPFCTLHNFPNTNEHTIEWAMDFFSVLSRVTLKLWIDSWITKRNLVPLGFPWIWDKRTAWKPLQRTCQYRGHLRNVFNGPALNSKNSSVPTLSSSSSISRRIRSRPMGRPSGPARNAPRRRLNMMRAMKCTWISL